MSVTITTNPDSITAAWRPVIFEAKSDRYDKDAHTYTITAVSSGTGTYARYATASPSVKVGDVVTGSGFTGLNVAYNVIQTVTVINAAWFETNLLFVATATGAGTMTRTNNNFQLRTETYTFPSTKLAFASAASAAPTGTWLYLGPALIASFLVGQTVLVEGTGSINYDGFYKVLVIAADNICISAAFSSNLSGTVRIGVLVGKKRILTLPDSSTFRLNCSGHLQSSLAPDLIDNAPANIQTPTGNSCKVYVIKFFEEYDDEDGLLQEQDSVYSDKKYTVRAVWQHNETQSMDSYLVSGTTKKFLTKAPLIKSIRVGEEEQLSFLGEANINITNPDFAGNSNGWILEEEAVYNNSAIDLGNGIGYGYIVQPSVFLNYSSHSIIIDIPFLSAGGTVIVSFGTSVIAILTTTGLSVVTGIPVGNLGLTITVGVGKTATIESVYPIDWNQNVKIQKYNLGGVAQAIVTLSLVEVVDCKGIVPINSNMFDATISKFDVWLADLFGTQKTEKRTFVIDKNSYQNPVRIHFENSLGGSDAYTFTGDYMKASKTKRTSFKKSLGIGFTIRDRGTSDLGNSSDVATEVYSQMLSNAEAQWLFELTASSSVFTKAIGQTVFTPINIFTESQIVADSTQPPQLKVVFAESNEPLGLNN